MMDYCYNTTYDGFKVQDLGNLLFETELGDCFDQMADRNDLVTTMTENDKFMLIAFFRVFFPDGF